MKKILLLTGAINIGQKDVPFTELKELQARVSQYIDAIDFAIQHYHTVDTIVFCENTNFALNAEPLFSRALAMGKQLELISYEGDYTAISQRGKGWGEGEIIRYAIEHSQFIKGNDQIFKLTGRLKVINFDQLAKTTNIPNLFIFKPKQITQLKLNHLETYLFKTTANFYLKNLADCYQWVDEPKGKYLEHIFYNQLQHLPLRSFPIAPQFEGISGTDRSSYQKLGWSKILDQCYFRMGLYHLQKNFFEKTAFQLVSRLHGLKSRFKSEPVRKNNRI